MRRVFDRFLVIFVAQIPGNVTPRIAHFTGRCGAAHGPFVADTRIATPQLSSAQPLELNLSIVVHLLIFCGTFVPPSADCAVVVVLAVSMRSSVR